MLRRSKRYIILFLDFYRQDEIEIYKKQELDSEKMCAKWLKWSTFVPQSGEFVPQSEDHLLYKCTQNWGMWKKYAIESLVMEKADFRDHTSKFDTEIKRL